MSLFQRVCVSPPLCARIPPLQPGLTGSPSHGHTSNEPQLVGAASDDPVSDVATQAGDNSAVRAPAPTTVELDATVAGSSSSAMDSPVPWINSVSAASESAAGALESGDVAAPGTCLCWGRPRSSYINVYRRYCSVALQRRLPHGPAPLLPRKSVLLCYLRLSKPRQMVLSS